MNFVRMSILFISENYYPNVSGVPVVVKYLAEGLVKKGHKVCIATCNTGGLDSHTIINNVEVFRFDIYRNLFHVNKGKIKSFVNFIVNSSADIVIFECTQCITTDLILPYMDQIKGKKILHSHGFSGLEGSFFSIKPDLKHTLGTTYNWFRFKWYYKYIIPRALSKFDKILCLAETDNTKEYVEERDYSVDILDNAADDMFFEENCLSNTLSKYTTLENDRYVMSCANYQYIKDQVSIINEYYASESSKDISLVCIGSQKNSYYEECVRTVESNERKYGHRDVHLLVGVDRKDIPAIEYNASLYLVASRCERYSISIIEAMSQGVPFISTNVGNARVLPGGITLFEGDKMSDKIDYLLTHKEAYDKYSKAGKEFAYKNCRISAVVDKLENIIKETVNG